MICQKMTAASSRITKLGGAMPPVMAFACGKTEPPSCFCCQIDILCVVPHFQNRGDVVFGVHGCK